MHINANQVHIGSDEGRFTLEVEDSEGTWITVDIHAIDLDAFYEQVRGRILPYLRERDEARRTLPVQHDGGYALSSPKHPDFHSIHADLYDQREGK